MKNFQHNVCIFCAENHERKCAVASKYILLFKECVAACEYIPYFLKNKWLLLKNINVLKRWKENVQLPLNMFFYVEDCVATSRCVSMFFKEHAAASKRYQWATASERKNVLLRNYAHLRNILKWKKD